MLSGGLDPPLPPVCCLTREFRSKECTSTPVSVLLTTVGSWLELIENPQRLINPVAHLATTFAIPIDIVDIRQEYLDVLRHPKFGYGKNMNPCIDCRIMTMTKARQRMEECGADFVFTGEVLGQRPMTQHRQTMLMVEAKSGLKGKLLRPLSAKLLPETEPELKGLVDRSRLHDFSGRSRKPQLALAKHYGVTNFPQPAGGCCFLTDPVYSRKLRTCLRIKIQMIAPRAISFCSW